jgi:hypothetical protein
MTINVTHIQIQALQTLAHGSITTSYVAVGSAFSSALRMFRIINNTDGDMIFTTDPTVSAGQFFVPAGSFVLYDISANSDSNSFLKLKGNTQFYVKYSTSPSKNDVWVEGIA